MKSILIVIIIVQLARSQHYLPAVTTEGNGTTNCPAAEDIEGVRKTIGNIINKLHFVPQCGDGLWRRVVYLNMSEPSQQCPSNWSEYRSNGVRACRRQPSSGSMASCYSVFFSTGYQYSSVCGRVLGYQLGTVDAFTDPTSPGFVNNARTIDATIDGAYLDGVSITHGTPRNHIWSYAAGSDPKWPKYSCPCIDDYMGPGPQPFVGNHYFCESGNGNPTEIAPNDKLWDGLMCINEGTCCTNKTLPWFIRELPNPTSDDIEVRICGDEGTDNEGTPVEQVEVYVQ